VANASDGNDVSPVDSIVGGFNGPPHFLYSEVS
jgi:hypothetical protein